MYKCELINENGSFDIETGFETVKDAFEWATGRGTHYNALVEDEETEELWKFPILSSKKDMFAKISARNGDIYTVNNKNYDKIIDSFKCNEYGCNRYDRDYIG